MIKTRIGWVIKGIILPRYIPGLLHKALYMYSDYIRILMKTHNMSQRWVLIMLLFFVWGDDMIPAFLLFFPTLQAFGTQKITFEDSWGTLSVGEEVLSLMMVQVTPRKYRDRDFFSGICFFCGKY